MIAYELSPLCIPYLHRPSDATVRTVGHSLVPASSGRSAAMFLLTRVCGWILKCTHRSQGSRSTAGSLHVLKLSRSVAKRTVYLRPRTPWGSQVTSPPEPSPESMFGFGPKMGGSRCPENVSQRSRSSANSARPKFFWPGDPRWFRSAEKSASPSTCYRWRTE